MLTFSQVVQQKMNVISYCSPDTLTYLRGTLCSRGREKGEGKDTRNTRKGSEVRGMG